MVEPAHPTARTALGIPGAAFLPPRHAPRCPFRFGTAGQALGTTNTPPTLPFTDRPNGRPPALRPPFGTTGLRSTATDRREGRRGTTRHPPFNMYEAFCQPGLGCLRPRYPPVG
eukprot:scaffold8148_cov241-Isochrysis_galbana.AAC.7